MSINATRILIFLYLSTLFLFSCRPQDESETMSEKYPYRITASVQNCEGCQVMMKADMHLKFKRIDSTVVNDGGFILEGFIPESGVYDISVRHPKSFIPVRIYLPVDSVHLTIDAENYAREGRKSWQQYIQVVSTSPVQRELEKYLVIKDSLLNKFSYERELVLAKFQQTYDSEDPKLVQLWADSLQSFGERFPNYWAYAADLFIREGASPAATVFAIMDSRNDRMATDRFLAYLAALPAENRQSQQGEYLVNYLGENKQSNKNNQRFLNCRIRSLDLKGSTPTGVELDESEIIRKNKLTLVEFWASWCGPCRMEMPKHYELYEQYRKKGLGFIAVSMDDRRELWLKAIAQDGLDVHHVSELKGIKGDDMRRFEIKGILANMLIDDTGKIIAVDISTNDLRNKLQESF